MPSGWILVRAALCVLSVRLMARCRLPHCREVRAVKGPFTDSEAVKGPFTALPDAVTGSQRAAAVRLVRARLG
ncbi:hypothetical protein D5S19_15075 [Amycolatopsis panacis]|uniref:Uncharacterized protein n=1 Tax=Amycolatopsis panacis TaxID=2340917 RepID=A0A419I4A3_9PSEU|nr:hypothetical protein D5S19_15075 [Amycolatopsis panacis]